MFKYSVNATVAPRPYKTEAQIPYILCGLCAGRCCSTCRLVAVISWMREPWCLRRRYAHAAASVLIFESSTAAPLHAAFLSHKQRLEPERSAFVPYWEAAVTSIYPLFDLFIIGDALASLSERIYYPEAFVRISKLLPVPGCSSGYLSVGGVLRIVPSSTRTCAKSRASCYINWNWCYCYWHSDTVSSYRYVSLFSNDYGTLPYTLRVGKLIYAVRNVILSTFPRNIFILLPCNYFNNI